MAESTRKDYAKNNAEIGSSASDYEEEYETCVSDSESKAGCFNAARMAMLSSQVDLDNFRARNATFFGSKRRIEASLAESTRKDYAKNNADFANQLTLYDEDNDLDQDRNQKRACLIPALS